MRTFASAFTLPSGGSWWNNSSTLSTKSSMYNNLISDGVIVDIKNERHVQSLLTENGQNNLNFTAHNSLNSDLIPGKSVNNRTVNMESPIEALGETFKNMPSFENAFHFTDPILSEFNRYKFVYENQVSDILGKKYETDKNGGAEANNKGIQKVEAQMISTAAVPSLFNPYFSVRVIGMVHNIPVHNNYKSYNSFSTNIYSISDNDNIKTDPKIIDLSDSQYYDPDFTDCSIKKLVELSNDFDPERECSKELGHETFRYADFMFCKDVGRISNNYMITLRRFAYPIGDNISNTWVENYVGPDIGRMICYIGEDNKLDDILKYQYSTSWKELTSKIQQKNSEEEDEEKRGIFGGIVNLTDPSYRKLISEGKAGSGNKALGWISNNSTLLSRNGTYEGAELLTNYDENKIYDQQDTVQDTHIYEGKLKFQHEFTLTFNYEMRAYDNINPRTAFMDLLANVHVVTYKHGSFWGGQKKLVGYSGNPTGWNAANALLDKAWEKAGNFCEGLLSGSIDTQSIMGSLSSYVEEFLDKAENLTLDDVKGGVKKAVEGAKKAGAGDVLKGMLKNRLGRPAVYAFNSLLTGSPVGFHHVTIGNPRAPILSMGNLIITNTTVQHYGPLGIDDFPTGLKVTVTLKHAKSRDALEIQQMYTGGGNALTLPINGNMKVENYINFGKDRNGNAIQMITDDKGVRRPEGDARLGDNNQIVKIFGTNNAGQIVANIALHARKP